MRTKSLIPTLRSAATLSYAADIASDAQIDPAAACRFINHSTFGANQSDAVHLTPIGYEQWRSWQFAVTAAGYPDSLTARAFEWSQDYFFQNSKEQPDQLRQRVALRLQKISVVSAVDVNSSVGMVGSSRLWQQNALDNVYVLLTQITHIRQWAST